MRTPKLDSGKRFKKYPFVLFLILILGIILNLFLNSGFSISENYSRRDSSNNHNGFLKNSDYWDLSSSPIFINGNATGVGAHNWTWAVNQDWCNGSGTWDVPYIIENITIDGDWEKTPIHIMNSDKSFIIRNCTLYGSRFYSDHTDYVGGIILENVSNGTLENNNCSENGGVGIILKNSENCTIKQNKANRNLRYGISLHNSNNSIIEENKVNSNLNGGIELYYSNNCTIEDNIVNSNEYHEIILDWSNDIDVINNTINNNDGTINSGIIGNTRYSYIFKNNIINGEYGINIGGYNNIIKNNDIYNCTIDGIFLNHYEIEDKVITDSINNKIIDNRCNNIENDGIVIHERNSDSLVRNNSVINSNSIGIRDNGYNSTLFNNTINLCKYGLSIDENADNGTYSNNIIDRCEVGMYLTGNGENHIINNNKFKLCGIFLNKDAPSSSLMSYNIDYSNTVNSKPIYYYSNSSNLNTADFTTYGSPGQIILINCSDSIISNLNIINSSYSVMIFYSLNIILRNNNFVNNMIGSFYLYETNNCNIVNNNISYNNGNGLYGERCYNLSIESNIIQNNEINGIYLELSTDIEILNNTISHNSIQGINFNGYGFNSDIINNTIKDNNQNGIKIINSAYFNIQNNNINQNALSGLNLSSCNNVNINNNFINKNIIDGIIILDSMEIEIYHNIISDNIHFSIFLGLNSLDINISSNYIKGSSFGIYVENCSNSSFISNIFFYNLIGVILQENSRDNLFYDNFFYSITKNAEDNGENNKWNYTTIGNYWNDYTGDGIKPYEITDINDVVKNRDFHPIIEDKKPDPIFNLFDSLIKNLLSPISLMYISIIISSTTLLFFVNRKKNIPDALGKSPSNFNFKTDNQMLNNFINSDELLEFTPIQDYHVSSLSPKELKRIAQLDLPINDKNQFIDELIYLNSKERKKILSEMLKSQGEDS
ncbi:MAG: right-handed parallel beta-helix repeat-containing protein [Candidatus Lokiarchaeota archaeon]|nr:right-handed parallel beta-helix repeat-containing protein [Candidatus Lokiarchaeota archaeon]